MQVIRMVAPNGRGIYDQCFWSEYCGGVDWENHPLPEDDGKFVSDITRFIFVPEILDRLEEYYGPNYKLTNMAFTTRIFEAKTMNLLFGFVNRDQYLRWMYDPQWKEALDNAGCVLKIFDVPDEFCIVGDSQVVFLEDKATEIDTVDFFYFD